MFEKLYSFYDVIFNFGRATLAVASILGEGGSDPPNKNTRAGARVSFRPSMF